MVNIYRNSASQQDFNRTISQELEDRPFIGQRSLTQESPSFSERFSSTMDYVFQVESAFGRESVPLNLAREQSTVLRENKELLGGLVDSSMFLPDIMGDPGDKYLDWARSNPDAIANIQNKYPDLGLKSYDEILSGAEEQFKRTAFRYERLNNDKSDMGMIKRFVLDAPGNMAGYLKDPVGLMSMFAPAGAAGTTLLKTFASFATREMAAAAAVEAINKPGEVELRREVLGQELPAGQVAQESAMEILGAGVAAGAIGTPLSKLFESAAIKNVSEGLLNKKQPDVTPQKHEEIVNSILDAEAKGKEWDMFEPEEAFSGVEKVTIEDEISSLRQDLELNDIVIEDEELGKLSLKQALQELDEDSKTFAAVKDCMAGKPRVRLGG